jgi:hypothetical protein
LLRAHHNKEGLALLSSPSFSPSSAFIVTQEMEEGERKGEGGGEARQGSRKEMKDRRGDEMRGEEEQRKEERSR